jgi:hypothetical protein
MDLEGDDGATLHLLRDGRGESRDVDDDDDEDDKRLLDDDAEELGRLLVAATAAIEWNFLFFYLTQSLAYE